MAEDRRHRALQRVAEPQWQVLRYDQLVAVGLTRHQIQALVDAALLHRRFKGIYTYGTDRPPWKGVLLAAQWSCGEDAYLTGRTALALQGVGQIYLRRIEVVVPRRTVRARNAPIELRRTSHPPARVWRDGPLRCAPIPYALWDLAREGTEVDALTDLITDAIHARRRRLHAEMRALLDGRAGEHGIPRLREAYAAYLPRPKDRSGLERSFDERMATRPNIPAPEHNFRLRAFGISWELDRYWPDEGVSVEMQGSGYHDAAEDREKDEFKAAKLARIGIQVVYFSEERWKAEPDACLDDLEAVLEQRRRERRAA